MKDFKNTKFPLIFRLFSKIASFPGQGPPSEHPTTAYFQIFTQIWGRHSRNLKIIEKNRKVIIKFLKNWP